MRAARGSSKVPFPSVGVGVLLAVAASVAPGQAMLPGKWEPYHVRSGHLVNPSPVAGVAVWQHVISLPPAVPWLRVHFSRAHLGKGSFVRITSLKDGDQQALHQEHLEQWSFGTAFFNGHAVLLEVVAGPNTSKNVVEIERIWAGEAPSATLPTQICGSTDDRTPSSNPAVARMVSSSTPYCTAWIINEPTLGTDRCHLSAGHCFGMAPSAVLQFNVPPSLANCTVVHPPASLQFAVDFSTLVAVNQGEGNDYAVFRCFRNPTTNRTTFEQQNSAITLAAAVPPNGTLLLAIGYGDDGTSANGASGGNANCTCTPSAGTGQRHMVQQVHMGTLNSAGVSTAYYSDIDTCGANSGGPVVHLGTAQAIAIHTHGACARTALRNSGTLVTHPGLRAAIHACNAPRNDECDDAVAIFDGVSGPFTNAHATTSSPAFPCRPQAGNDVWFSYVATCSGSVNIDTCAAARNFDTVLEVLSGAGCHSLTSLACNDDTPGCGSDGLGSRVSFVAAAATRYFVRVGGYNGASGQFSLTVTGCNAFNECAGAVPLVAGIHGPFTNATATTSTPPWPCGGSAAGNDVWFRYDVPCAAVVTFSTCWSATNFDTVLQVFSGTCGNLTSVGCNDNDASCSENVGSSRVIVPVATATTLFVRVGGFAGARGVFAIGATSAPPNDECAAAITVQSGVNGPFCNEGASLSSTPWPCGGPVGADVWFRFTAPCTGLLVADTCSARRNFDTKLQVLSGSCGGLSSLACNDDACGVGSSLAVPVVASQTYWLRVGGADGGSTGIFDLTLRCTHPNDECAFAATVATGINGPFSNVNATTSNPAWPCGRGGADVWFRYAATCTAPHTFRTCSRTRTVDTTLEVFSGGCGLLTSLGCDNDSCVTGSSVTVPLTASATYYVRVGGVADAVGAFDLEVAPGTGTGSLSRLTTGCGATTITASGAPNLLGAVHVQLGGLVGSPLLAIGFTLLNAPVCPPAACRLGPNPQVVLPANGITLVVPCNPFLIGSSLYLQGVDIGASGGCTGFATFTDTVVLTIG